MNLINKITHFICSIVFFIFLTIIPAYGNLPSHSFLEQSLKQAQSLDQSILKNQQAVEDWQESLLLLEKIKEQQSANNTLNKIIDDTPMALLSAQKSIESLKNNSSQNDLDDLPLTELQSELISTQNKLQLNQTDLANINSKIVAQRAAPERAQNSLTSNLIKTQNIEKKLFATDVTESQKTKLNLQLRLIQLQNNYNQLLLQGDSKLLSLYSSQLEAKKLAQYQLQQQQSALQNLINHRKLQERQQQATELELAQREDKNVNPIIQKEQQKNVALSQELVRQTTKLNALSQDNLRIKSVLNNLQQTQRNINEQISALQGTLVLSRIINKQKQLLPQDKLINGLSKQITELRVSIFDLTELRDSLYDTHTYAANLLRDRNIILSNQESKLLQNILQERYRLLSDEINLLNNQLNLSINIELNQKQVTSISDSLEDQLQQQSFWVRSNSPINLSWFSSFLPRLKVELQELHQQLSIFHWKRYELFNGFSILTGILILVLFTISGVVFSQRKHIENRLSSINSCVNTLKKDRQRYTPETLFLNLIQSIPSTALVLAALLLISFLFFDHPVVAWAWSVRMAMFWLFFMFILRVFNPSPNSVGARQFGISQRSLSKFTDVVKSSIIVSYLWLNASILTHLDGGVSNDVIGQVITLGVLVFSLLVIVPKIRHAFTTYQREAKIQEGIFPILYVSINIISFIAPIGLIILIGIGYYYTAIKLMRHLILSYFVFILWIVLKDSIYRSLLLFSRRLSYRRLLEKQAKAREKNKAKQQEDDVSQERDESFIQFQKEEDELMTVAKIKDQVLRVVDLGLFLALIGGMYWVWSDLITVAYYLEGITLWEQQITTATGTMIEAVTLWNLLIAMIILLGTYALVRNLPGLLEVIIFSHIKLSQGTPYTITTLLTYFIVALGAASAFSTLGMSWNKLQWLFAALSVGLGFGLQEIFANFVSGIIILFERPVRIGDVVTIGNYSGTVSRIRIRSTTIVDFDRKEIIVPNKAFVTERIINWALSNSITRVKIYLGVAYGSDLELVKKLLLDIADECPFALKEPKPSVYFLSFGASTLDHELRVYVNDVGHRNKTIDYVNHCINKRFAEHNIDIAYNQLDVYIKNTSSNEEIKLESRVTK